MRIATRTVYQLQTSQLGGLYKTLADNNTTVSTKKRINNLADDPVGLTQVLNFKSGMEYLSKINTNIENGRTWLNTVETTLSSVEDITLEMKTLAQKMKNASVNPQQREDAINQVNSALAELINLANTQIKGEYIFGGSRTNVQPFVADSLTNPTSIVYNGDLKEYQIKISQEETMAVGQVGSDTFWEDDIVVDSTNNTIDLKEIIKGGFQIGRINTGETITEDVVNIEVTNYDALDKGTAELKPLQFKWNEEDQVWEVKNDPGYGLPATIDGTEDAFDIDFDNDGSPDAEVRLTQGAENEDYVEFDIESHNRSISAVIPDGTYTRESLGAAVENALTKASEENGYKVKYDVKYDNSTKKYSITYDEDSHSGYLKTDFLWETGDHSDRSIGPDLGFDVIDSTFEPAISDGSTGKIIFTGVNDTLDFSIDGGVTTQTITIPAGKYTNEALAAEIETQMEGAVNSVTFAEKFEVKFNNDDVRFEFDASETEVAAGDFQMYWNTGPSGLGDTLGFNTDVDDLGSLEYKGMSFAPKSEIVAGKNDTLDFTLDGTNYSVVIPEGDYTNKELAEKIQSGMELAAGLTGFDVQFDEKNQIFQFDAAGTGAAAFELLFNTGANAGRGAGETLGFDITADSTGALSYDGSSLPSTKQIIAGVNDRINFKELPQNGAFSPELSFTIDSGSYSGDELAEIIEFNMEQQSSAEGYNIDYTVSYDAETDQFKFRENGSDLDEIQFLWNTGEDRPVSEGGTGRNAGVTLGFDESEDHSAVLTGTSDDEASWGLFDTLVDLKTYLENNDIEGMNRTLTRLDKHYDEQLSMVTEVGMKESRLITKQSILTNVSYRYDVNRAEIEEADMVKAISDLVASETAYQAALSSSAKVMKLSLADYL